MSQTGADALSGTKEYMSGAHTFTVEDQTRVIASGMLVMIYGKGQSQARCNHERITNEANALQLISRETTIPVPQLIDFGVHPDGRRYLVTELIDGFPLDELLSKGCPMLEGQKHTDQIPCQICQRKAYSNALDFIQCIVMPQLLKLKSRERGQRTLEEPEYVFQHGDLSAQNILMDRQTLQVAALIDWEYAGFFPPGIER
ncbi:kinase-like domain-containing protein [Podospora didyma]|uniref:Kinase-like domain-containing protein n=1 Tax=Podospora didyma TaxID=330526 RepID=A0AAE0KK21_9PEZI|nr:kinase-like domain-containing protein [Podospora didyma]